MSVTRCVKWILTGCTVLCFACFPNKTAEYVVSGEQPADTLIKVPVKAFFSDGSQVIFPEGFEINNRIVYGRGARFSMHGSPSPTQLFDIPLDSISAMNYYHLENSGGSIIGSMLLGLYSVTITPLAVYCTICPKCCFGSCPTVYTGGTLQAELFSYSISHYFQESDVDRIYPLPDDSGRFELKVANEALETHYINFLQPWQVLHPKGSFAFADQDQEILVTADLNKISGARNSLGQDITNLISVTDDKVFRSDSLFDKQLESSRLTDWITVDVPVEAGQNEICLVLNLRNTLLTTVLFYDLVMESQGVFALEWMDRMQNDYLYARMFTELYRRYAGIRIYAFENDRWVQKQHIGDVGPIAWKEMAVRIPLDPSVSPVRLKLEFFPDNIMIDRIAWSERILSDTEWQSTACPIRMIRSDSDIIMTDLEELIAETDDEYLITYPGQSYRFTYQSNQNDALASSIFLKSKGYYLEWLRGNWITGTNNAYHFDPYDIEGTIDHLKNSWLDNRMLLESEFFKNRIPLREAL